MNVKFRVKNLDEVTAFIKSLPRGVKAAAMRAISEYIVGDARHGLKHDVAYKYVSRKQAYPPSGWQSDKQRRYVMMKLRSGEMQIGRQNSPTNMSKSWTWQQKDSDWRRTEILGQLPFSGFPSRHNRLAGWRHFTEVVQSNMKGAMKKGVQAVNKWLDKKAK